MWIPPLLIIPLLVYNAVSYGVISNHGQGWASPVASFSMPSGGIWSLNVGDLLIILALGLLLIEVLRTYRTPGLHPVALIGSGLLLAVYLGEFLLVPAASTSLFFICVSISLIDFLTRAASSLPRGAGKY